MKLLDRNLRRSDLILGAVEMGNRSLHLGRFSAAEQGGPPMDEVIKDSTGVEIKPGARVLGINGLEIGSVTKLVPLDGDVDDEGRPVAVGPFVVVRYDDGDEERLRASWDAEGPWDSDNPNYTCEDLVVKA